MLLATLLAAALALPVTEPATDVGATGATLNGTVDAPTNAHFEYGTTTAYGLETESQPVPAGPVSDEVEGLTVDTTYHYRIVSDEGEGEDMTFTTAGPPRVSQQHSADVTTRQATVTAAIDTRGIETSYRIQWGRTTDYGRFTPVQTADTGTTTATVTITGLSPNRTYHWRTRASNAAGTTVGADRKFKTGPLATSVTLALSRSKVRWGDELRLGGRVKGNGVRGLTVVLEQQRFPLDQGFTAVDTARTGGDRGDGAARRARDRLAPAAHRRPLAAGAEQDGGAGRRAAHALSLQGLASEARHPALPREGVAGARRAHPRLEPSGEGQAAPAALSQDYTGLPTPGGTPIGCFGRSGGAPPARSVGRCTRHPTHVGGKR